MCCLKHPFCHSSLLFSIVQYILTKFIFKFQVNSNADMLCFVVLLHSTLCMAFIMLTLINWQLDDYFGNQINLQEKASILHAKLLTPWRKMGDEAVDHMWTFKKFKSKIVAGWFWISTILCIINSPYVSCSYKPGTCRQN